MALGLGLNLGLSKRAGGINFLATDISDCAVWLDYADTDTIAGASQITAVTDKTGNSNNATQGTSADQPTTGGNINGLNAINLNGTSQHFNIPTSDIKTLFIVGVGDTSNTSQCFGSQDNAFGVVNGFLQDGITNTEQFRGINVASWYNGGVEETGGTRNDAYDATITDSAVQTLIKINSGYNNVNVLYGGYGQFYKGLMGEYIGYTRLLTDAENNQVGNYLRSKWGAPFINFNLPPAGGGGSFGNSFDNSFS